MEIIKLDPRLKKKATQVIVAAFYDYPMFTFYFPEIAQRARIMRWYLGNVLNCALRYGEVFTTPEVAGVIFTLPPGHTAISQGEYIRNGFLPAAFVLGLRNFVRSQHCEEFVTHIHAKIMNGRPHYYLWGLVVDPACQRKGVGTALLKPFLQKADSEKMPVYLETHDEKNVAYYQWQGFDLRQATMISKYDIPIWCMVREPKGTSGT